MSSAPSVTPTTIAHALLIMVEQIVIVSIIMCVSIWGQLLIHIMASSCLVMQCVFFLVHWAIDQILLALGVYLCISVSLTTPVRMEEHALLVLTTTLTTPAHVLQISQEQIAQVKAGTQYKSTLGSQYDVMTALHQSESDTMRKSESDAVYISDVKLYRN